MCDSFYFGEVIIKKKKYCDLSFIPDIIFLEVIIIVSSSCCMTIPYLGYFK